MLMAFDSRLAALQRDRDTPGWLMQDDSLWFP